jgi:hypothetical protein
MKEQCAEKRIELEHNEYFTQINELNSISELPNEMTFTVNPLAKILLPFVIIGSGLIGAIYSFLNGEILASVLIVTGSILFYFILFFFDHKKRDKKYFVNDSGLKVDDELYEWKKITDIHVKHRDYSPKGRASFICFEINGYIKEFQLDSMTKSESEIIQIIYMYRQKWLKNSTTNIELN